jgi:hypothetical protein
MKTKKEKKYQKLIFKHFREVRDPLFVDCKFYKTTSDKINAFCLIRNLSFYHVIENDFFCFDEFKAFIEQRRDKKIIEDEIYSNNKNVFLTVGFVDRFIKADKPIEKVKLGVDLRNEAPNNANRFVYIDLPTQPIKDFLNTWKEDNINSIHEISQV